MRGMHHRHHCAAVVAFIILPALMMADAAPAAGWEEDWWVEKDSKTAEVANPTNFVVNSLLTTLCPTVGQIKASIG